MSVLIYLVNGIVLLMLVFALLNATKEYPLKRFFWPALALKITAGIALGLVFKYYYGFGDTLTYFKEGCRYAAIVDMGFTHYIESLFDDTVAPFQSIFHNQPRALLISKISSGFALITNNNYWLTSIYFSLFAFSGIWILANTVERLYKNKLAVIMSLFVFPSVVFWSAGISKESLAIGALTWLMSSFLTYVDKWSSITLKRLLFDVIAIAILWYMRYFYAGAFLLTAFSGIFCLIAINNFSRLYAKPYYQAVVFLFCAVVMTWTISLTRSNFHLDNIGRVIAKDHAAYVNKSDPNQLIQYDNLDGSISSLLKNSPKAAFSGLFRPLPTDGVGWLAYISQVENVLILLLALIAIASLKSSVTGKTRIVLFTAFSYVFILATLLALATPNFGSLVRYKVGFLPVFLLLITLHNPLIKRLNQRLFS